jgi:UDPglucose 6-dehydrogenase
MPARPWATAARSAAFDPVAAENVRAELGPDPVLCANMYETLEGADGLVISTDWDEFKNPDFGRMVSTMGRGVIFDGRNLYRRQHMGQLGFHYYSVGRTPVLPE